MWRDDAYLLDILIAARKVLRYVADLSWETFREDGMAQDAVIRNLQIVGEAAWKISDDFRSGHPEVPWNGIVGLRHRLVHDYSRVDMAKIWETAVDHIPPLIRLIEPLVPPEDQA